MSRHQRPFASEDSLLGTRSRGSSRAPPRPRRRASAQSPSISPSGARRSRKSSATKSPRFPGTEQATLLYGTKAWSDFSLHPTLLANLASLHCDKPTVIQEKGVDAACRGKDVLGAAPTGSGKTLAFCVPLVDWLLKRPAGEDAKWRVRAVVISPTRELALQTLRVLTRLCEGSGVK